MPFGAWVRDRVGPENKKGPDRDSRNPPLMLQHLLRFAARLAPASFKYERATLPALLLATRGPPRLRHARVGDTLPVQGRLLEQIESLDGKPEFILDNGQTAFGGFHTNSPCLSRLLVGGKIGAVSAARVVIGPGHNLPARVLPNLTAIVPMKTKL